MPLLWIGLAAVACWFCWGTPLFWPAVVVGVLSFWSHGTISNFRDDPMLAPNWAVAVGWLTIPASIGLLVAATVFY